MNRNVPTTKLTPSDLRAEAQRLIRAGKMPSLSQVLDTIREVKGNPEHGEYPRPDQCSEQREPRRYAEKAVSLARFWETVDPLSARGEPRRT